MNYLKICMVLLFVFLFGNLFAQNQILVPYRKGGLWGYADTTGKVLIEPQFLRPVAFKNDQAYIETINGIGVINTNGNFLVEPNFTEIIPLFDSIYYCKYKDNYGLMHANKDTMAPFIYWRKSFVSDVYEYTNSKSKVKIVSLETRKQKDIYRYQNNKMAKILTLPKDYQLSYNTVRMLLTVNYADSVFTYDINGQLLELELLTIIEDEEEINL